MRKAAFAAAFAITAAAGAAGARASGCELALALALDISSSVNEREYEIQKGGLVAALRHPEVREALLAQAGGVRIAVYEWSGWQQQDLVIDWSDIRNMRDIDALAGALDGHQRRYAEFSTAIGRALEYGARLFNRMPSPCARRVLDVSGDGVSNEGAAPIDVRARGALSRMTVNALVIKGADPDPEIHYRETVIGGPGAFMMVARNGFEDYPDMILGKLLREIEPPLFLGSADRPAAPK